MRRTPEISAPALRLACAALLIAAIAPSAHAQPPPEFTRRQQLLMGTRFAITVAGTPDKIAEEAATAAFAEVARIERLMSEWLPDSELAAVNRMAGQRPVAVSPETFEVVRRATDLAAASGGAFDPTWAALRGLWDFKATPPQLPSKAAIDARLALTGYKGVVLDAGASTLFLERPGMALGLGGIAKGYAIDRAAAALRARGIDNFIVDGGGDLLVSGRKGPGRPWMLGVQHPRAPGKLMAKLPLTSGAVVTSGDYERYFELGGRRYHHIIDLRTGYPATRSIAVTVQAPNATLADALATALFVLGPKEGLALARRLGVEAAIVDPDCRVHATPKLATIFGERCQVR